MFQTVLCYQWCWTATSDYGRVIATQLPLHHGFNITLDNREYSVMITER